MTCVPGGCIKALNSVTTVLEMMFCSAAGAVLHGAFVRRVAWHVGLLRVGRVLRRPHLHLVGRQLTSRRHAPGLRGPFLQEGHGLGGRLQDTG